MGEWLIGTEAAMHCVHCGRRLEAGARFCAGCGAVVHGAGASPSGAEWAGVVSPPLIRLMRPRQPRMIAGVCAAFALRYGWDLTLVRVLTAVGALLTSGLVLVAYLVAWVAIPEAPYALPGAGQTV